MSKHKKTLYLTSAQLAEALEESQKLGQPTEQVCIYFKMIAQHLLGDSRYRNYPKELQEDMVSNAVMKMIKNIKNYKKEYADKCFNYWTRCVEHAFWSTLGKHYKYMNMVRQLTLDFADTLEPYSPQLAQQIRDKQIKIEHNKDKLTFKKEHNNG